MWRSTVAWVVGALTQQRVVQLIVALVLVNVVIAVLLDEFSKAAEKKDAFVFQEDAAEKDR